MKIGAVIIARYNSSRFYGKVLKEICGVVALEHTYNRLRKVLPAEQIVIATSIETTDDPINDFALKNGWQVFRGSLDNVAERFLQAGEEMNWDYMIRINGDNIFIDLQCLGNMLDTAITGQFDFLTNVKDRTFPKGMSIEFVKKEFYQNAYEKLKHSSEYTEHVTLALYQNNWGEYAYFFNTEIDAVQGVQLALDTPEDFERIGSLITMLRERYEDYTLLDIKLAYEQLER